MNAADLQHGFDFEGERVTGWLGSEKLDGCRALWTGDRMLTRTGREIRLPAAFRAALPGGISLDGEIHAGRGGFEASRLATQYGKWAAGVRFTVFDAPEAKGAWEARMATARAVWRDCVAFWPVTSRRALLNKLQAILATFGEGVVIREPAAPYTAGRTRAVLKLKSADWLA